MTTSRILSNVATLQRAIVTTFDYEQASSRKLATNLSRPESNAYPTHNGLTNYTSCLRDGTVIALRRRLRSTELPATFHNQR
jgi:hypothetical protein